MNSRTLSAAFGVMVMVVLARVSDIGVLSA
jgi:hypothetical protein